MGVQILTDKFKQLRAQNSATARAAGLTLSLADAICADEFLKLIALNRTALAQFKLLLINLQATAVQVISTLQLTIAQLETINNVLTTLYNTSSGAVAQAKSSVAPYPFSNANFSQCPPVQVIKKAVVSLQEKVVATATALVPKKFKNSLSARKEMQFRILKNKKQINKTKRELEVLKVQVQIWGAMVEAIEQQFGV